MVGFLPRVRATAQLSPARYFSGLATIKVVPLDNAKSGCRSLDLLTKSRSSSDSLPPLPLETNKKCDSLHFFKKAMFMFVNLTAASLSTPIAPAIFSRVQPLLLTYRVHLKEI
jgi:hypothetical protein